MSGIPTPGIVALTAARLDRHPFEEWCQCARCRHWQGLAALGCFIGTAVLTVLVLAVYFGLPS